MSDPGAEEALYDIQSMRPFCGLELDRDAIRDETTILNFPPPARAPRSDEGDLRGRCADRTAQTNSKESRIHIVHSRRFETPDPSAPQQ